MRIIGLAGWSGSGKTTLITKLIPRLIARGVKASTLKHAHHGFDLFADAFGLRRRLALFRWRSR